jgi:ubiquitin-like 1-activating enzyme E1 A
MTSAAIWEYQSRHQGALPDDASQAAEVQSIADSILVASEANKQVLTSIPQDLIL